MPDRKLPPRYPTNLPPDLMTVSADYGGVLAAAFVQENMDMFMDWLEAKGMRFDLAIYPWLKAQHLIQRHALAFAAQAIPQLTEPARQMSVKEFLEIFPAD
jgi:hypothetical protein